MPRLRCQLSDQKQTPVYFPIYDKENVEQENNASPTEKEKLVNVFMGIDVIIALIFLIISLFVLQTTDYNFVTNITEELFFWIQNQPPMKQRSIKILMFSILTVPITLWELYKRQNMTYIVFLILALFFFISCILSNIGALILISGFPFKRAKNTLVLFALIVAKIMLIQRWFYK